MPLPYISLIYSGLINDASYTLYSNGVIVTEDVMEATKLSSVPYFRV